MIYHRCARWRKRARIMHVEIYLKWQPLVTREHIELVGSHHPLDSLQPRIHADYEMRP